MTNLDAETMANKWTDSYHSEAQKCTDEWGNAVIGMDPESMKYILMNTFREYNIDVQQGIENAINAYWKNVTLNITSLPPSSISGITNIISSTGSVFSLVELPTTTSVNIGSTRVTNGLYNKTTSIQTTFTYMHTGSPPYIATVNSTLR